MSQSVSISPVAVLAALKKGAEQAGGDVEWQTSGPHAELQQYFVDNYFVDYNVSAVAPDVSVSNEGPLVKAKLDMMATWQKPGKSRTREVEGREYDYAYWEKSGPTGPHWEIPPQEFLPPVSPSNEDNLIMSWLIQKGSDGMWANLFGKLHVMMIDDERAPQDALSLLKLVDHIESNKEPKMEEVECWLPMIDHSYKCSLPWLNGMKAKGDQGEWPILGNHWEMSLRLDEVGVRAEAGGSILGCIYVPKTPTLYVFDRPFLLWITAPYLARSLSEETQNRFLEDHPEHPHPYLSLDKPYFAAYVTPEDWKKPNSEAKESPELAAEKAN